MGKLCLLICDRCDVRDNIEHSPCHEIEALRVVINLLDRANEESFGIVYLCKSCRKDLSSAIISALTQIPRKA